MRNPLKMSFFVFIALMLTNSNLPTYAHKDSSQLYAKCFFIGLGSTILTCASIVIAKLCVPNFGSDILPGTKNRDLAFGTIGGIIGMASAAKFIHYLTLKDLPQEELLDKTCCEMITKNTRLCAFTGCMSVLIPLWLLQKTAPDNVIIKLLND